MDFPTQLQRATIQNPQLPGCFAESTDSGKTETAIAPFSSPKSYRIISQDFSQQVDLCRAFKNLS